MRKERQKDRDRQRQRLTEKDEGAKEEMEKRGERRRSEEGKTLCTCTTAPTHQFLPKLQNYNIMCVQWVLDYPNSSVPVNSQHWSDK